jgi:hypothetical protein
MKRCSRNGIWALGLAAALTAPATHAGDLAGLGSGSFDTSSAASMPADLSFEEAARPSSEPQVLAAPTPNVAPAVPEPTSYLLLVAGLGLIGLMVLRRK